MSQAMKQKYKQQADTAYKTAIKRQKGGWLSKPNHDDAVTLFEEAVKYYKLSGNVDNAIDSMKNAAIENIEINCIGTAAKWMEDAALLVEKKDKDLSSESCKLICEYMMTASEYYRDNSQPDKSAEVLSKCARKIQKKQPKQACKLMDQACLIFEDEKRGEFSRDQFTNSVQMCLRYDEIDMAISLITRQRAQYLMYFDTYKDWLYKICLSKTILHLHTGDVQTAYYDLDEAEKKMKNYKESQYWDIAYSFVNAYRTKSKDGLEATKKLQSLGFIDTSIVRLAKKLTLENIKQPTDDTIMININLGGKIDEDEEPIEDDGKEDNLEEFL